jgi:ribose transport system substrate-binding protein
MFTTRRTVLTAVPALLGLGALSACGRGEGSGGATGGGGGQTVVLALSTLTNPFFVQVRDGAQAKADELGITLEIQDASNDAATQTNQLNNAVTTGASLVIVNPVDSDAIGPAVQALNDNDIPVIALDRGVTDGEVATFVSSDNVLGGNQAAELLAAAVEEQGQVIVLQGIAGSSASRDRGQGFEEAIAAFSGIEVVAKQTANFDRAQGLNVATNLLQANPDVVGIFAENDEMALGAIEAAGERAGQDLFVVGFDGTDEGLAAVADGTMYATIAQQAGILGSTAVEQASKVLAGETVEAQVPVETVQVTADNVAEYQQ